jgi:hypothetical protein
MIWLESCFPMLANQIVFVAQMANNFATETVIGPEQFKKMNANFNELKGNLGQLTIKVPALFLRRYQKLLANILATSSFKGEREKLLADLIHMHINRLFSVDQRMYETIIYHHLLRILQTKRAISKDQ